MAITVNPYTLLPGFCGPASLEAPLLAMGNVNDSLPGRQGQRSLIPVTE
ncbi:hypothetical protein [Superficieibacter sp. HKU1]|nr:hypothetical protein [Superficieibacter sp. HKU1]WES67475.1 hypothetical protein P0H77_17905 [Superficieibacter sp. HKU1]